MVHLPLYFFTMLPEILFIVGLIVGLIVTFDTIRTHLINKGENGQLVERLLAVSEIRGSNPLSSNFIFYQLN